MFLNLLDYHLEINNKSYFDYMIPGTCPGIFNQKQIVNLEVNLSEYL